MKMDGSPLWATRSTNPGENATTVVYLLFFSSS
jgi:hypothetical protein